MVRRRSGSASGLCSRISAQDATAIANWNDASSSASLAPTASGARDAATSWAGAVSVASPSWHRIFAVTEILGRDLDRARAGGPIDRRGRARRDRDLVAREHELVERRHAVPGAGVARVVAGVVAEVFGGDGAVLGAEPVCQAWTSAGCSSTHSFMSLATKLIVESSRSAT